ncbi:hypothetical protein AK88_02339 [Plasmodium fragile]|uniref:EMP1-trafficking protein n=1 Tax=Plasmodium fragile TaxID=5857 RepID=A0A0D9QM12_PLAFR|nr:uncharacterized protein AK88_02339 [Plasmodium fragile]KJP88064.1 hypothetical protein AK88_02339 [Plasmodium fragile]
MKIQYHLLLLTFLLSEDVLCNNSGYEDVKGISAEVKKGSGGAGSDYLATGGKKALWPWNGNDKKGHENKSSKDEDGLLSSLLGSVKRLLPFNEKGIQNNVQGISDNVVDMKDAMIKNSSNLVKHANKLKEEIQKNTAYWANVVKTTVSEELHHIDQFSKEQLDKLKKDPEHKNFFTKLFSGDSAAADVSSVSSSSASNKETEMKNAQGAVGSKAPPGHDDAEVENEEKAKSFWDFLHTGAGGNASPATDEKEPSTGFLRMFKTDKNKPSSVTHNKESFSWFSTHSSEDGSATQQNHPDNEKEKKQGFTFNIFNSKDSSQESRSVPHSNTNDKGIFTQWFNPPTAKGTNKDEHLPQKEQSGGMTQDSVNDSQHVEVHEGEKQKKNFSLLNMWKATHKEKDAEEQNNGEVDTDVGSNMSQVTEGEGSDEESTKGGSFFFNPFEGLGFKSKGESSHTKDTAPGKTNIAEGMSHADLSKGNNYLVDLMKNVYEGKNDETGEQAQQILSFMHTKHEHDANTNCHPLVSFKVCLNTCFNVPSAMEGGSSDGSNEHKKKNLSAGDYKKLEACILKCKNTNLSEQAPGCANKDGSVTTSDKTNYEEKIKNLKQNNYTLGEQSSVFSDLTTHDKYAEGETPSHKSSWVMGASGTDNAGDETEVQNGSRTFPTLADGKLGAHLYSVDSSNTGGHNKEPTTDGNKHSMVGENSFSFFKAFAPQTGSTSDGVNTHGATNPLGAPHNDNNNKAGTEGAAANLTAAGVHGEDLEGAIHGSGSGGGSGDGDTDDEDDWNDFSYISQALFLLLLLVTFFVYLSAFTNIITQFYVSFKEKVCLYIKGQYRSPFDQAHGESAEAFLPKGLHSYGNASVHGSYDNLCLKYVYTLLHSSLERQNE